MVEQVYITSDGELFTTRNLAEAHESTLRSEHEKRFLQYTKTSYAGKELLKEHSLDEHGIWSVCGEAANVDFGGHHHEPYLFTAKGTLEAVIREAVDTSRFFTWGGGGSITKVDIIDLDNGDKS